MTALTKSKGLNTLLEKIQEIDLPSANSSALESFMQATKILDSFTKEVKNEMLARIKNGDEFEGFKLAERKTRVISDIPGAVELLKKWDYDEGEIFDTKLKSVAELKKLVGEKSLNKLPIDETVTEYIRKK